MSEFFHSYLTSLIYTGVICSLALIVTPDGRVKSVVRLASCVAMISVILSPAVLPDADAFSSALTKYRIEAEEYAEAGEKNMEDLNRRCIQEQCEAYILDKAEKLGITVGSVSVGLMWSTDGYWYPVSAELICECDPDLKNKLASYIESELGIMRGEQNWSDTYEKQQDQ